MTQAQDGDKVRVHYTGTLNDGSKFDSSRDRQKPLEFTIGQKELVPGFEQAVVGMEQGESKTVNLTSDKAYGPHDPAQVIEMQRSKIPPELELEIGLRLQGTSPKGKTTVFTLVGFGESTVTLDGNHPLAGKDLNFEIELLEIL